MGAKANERSTKVQRLTQEEADRAGRHLAAMSLAIEQVALTHDFESRVSLWMGYYTNLKNLEQIVPPVWEPPPDSTIAGGPRGDRIDVS